MENATKALLIAASVLIAIVLIAVGIRILGATQPTVNQVEDVSKTLEVSVYNSKFTQYEGKQKGSAVKALLRLIKQNNTTNNNKITIEKKQGGSTTTIQSDDDFNTFMSNIEVTKMYNVNISTNSKRICKSCYSCL